MSSFAVTSFNTNDFSYKNFLRGDPLQQQRDSCSVSKFPLHPFYVPRMANTMPSFSTSMDPEQTKKMACRASPCRRRYSPGAQKEVLICSDRERRQPRLAEANSDSSRISLLRCMVMSDRSSSGKSFSSWGDDGGERKEEWNKKKREMWCGGVWEA